MKLWMAGVLVSLFVSPLWAMDPTTVRSGELVAFVTIDSDHNGYVSRVEAGSVKAVESGFDTADTNQDGLLDQDEYIGLRNTHDANPRQQR